MTRSIVIIGAGFAGLWSALAAKRVLSKPAKGDEVEVHLVAPEPTLVIRPRLYEANAASMQHSLVDLLRAANIKYIQGCVSSISPADQTLTVHPLSGAGFTLNYDRLILAAGSVLARPAHIAGVKEHTFDIDTLESAAALEYHFAHLATLPPSPGRDTIVVSGAGFTGVELATELPQRLATMLPAARIVLIESATKLAHSLGPNPRPLIASALRDLGVEVKTGAAVAAVDAAGVTLASGERIETLTPVWTAGMRAHPLAAQLAAAEKDSAGRVIVAADLHVAAHPAIFAAGDAAHALADSSHAALMSCQHALTMGRFAGYNAARDVLGCATAAYAQPVYNTCLDLGGSGAVVTAGWERRVQMTGETAKRVKAYINTTLIYPPGNAKDALEAAGIEQPDADELFAMMLKAVA